jgi:hypothetical protein
VGLFLFLNTLRRDHPAPLRGLALDLNTEPREQIGHRRCGGIDSRATTTRDALDEQGAAKHARDPQWEEDRLVHGEMPESMRLVSVNDA